MVVIWSVYALAIVPVDLVDSSGDGSRGGAAESQPADRQPRLAPLSEFAVIYQRDLRKPVTDRKPPPPTPRPEIPLLLKLEGTVVEEGNNSAFLRTKRGQSVWAGVGETVDEAKILKIEPGQVTVLFHGKQRVLTVNKQGGS
jgi:hypothetical protein